MKGPAPCFAEAGPYLSPVYWSIRRCCLLSDCATQLRGHVDEALSGSLRHTALRHVDGHPLDKRIKLKGGGEELTVLHEAD